VSSAVFQHLSALRGSKRERGTQRSESVVPQRTIDTEHTYDRATPLRGSIVILRQSGALLQRYLAPQWRIAGVLALALLGSVALELAIPQIVRLFIDTAVSDATLVALLRLAGIFLAVTLAFQALSVSAVYLSERLAWGATNALRSDLALHCLKLDMSFHHAHPPGELIERIDGDVQALANFFSQFVVQLLGSALLLLGVLVLMYREDWRAGLALTAFVLVALLVLGTFRNLAVPYAETERAVSGELFGFIEERLAAIDDMRANGAGAYVTQRFARVAYTLYERQRRADMMTSSMLVFTRALFALGIVTALGLSAYLHRQGAITLGTVFLIFQYTQLLRRPIEQISEQLRDFQRAAASVLRISRLQALRPQILERGSTTLPAGALAVAFEHVSFSYPTEAGTTANRTLDTISFALPPGATLALIGRTGSGKTTIARLLCRFYEPDSGTISLGGIRLSQIALAELRTRVALVTQEVHLFQATLRDNLTLFDPDISDERVLAVLRELGCVDSLLHHPAGLARELGPSGAGLSAGEAQLVAFARVCLRDPGLIILDEASSRLDPVTEALIERAMVKLLHGRTAIIIAHRLRTVARADSVLLLDQGRVREHGVRAQLARDAGSAYAQLLRMATGEVAA
jgi:ABC-type multidrug transport system fused ATPase/permease subunit